MSVFTDTSGLFALIDRNDEYHSLATQIWNKFIEDNTTLHTSNYIVVESMMLLGRRLGLQAIRDFSNVVVPVIEVHWVEPTVHDRAVAALRATDHRRLSLVDCVSFEVMRDLGLTEVFTFDSDFERQGFRTVR